MTDNKINGLRLRPSVILVEDDDAIRRSFQLLLRARGFDVRAYASSGYALSDKQNRSAACLIADLILPGADGFELLHSLRADGWAGPAILISGYMTPERAKQAQDAGFDAILEKPVSDSRLIDIVNGLIPKEGTENSIDD